MEFKIDYSTNIGFRYGDAAEAGNSINREGELVSNGMAAVLLCSPYSDSVPGTYDTTLHYSVDSVGEDFDVVLFTVTNDCKI